MENHRDDEDGPDGHEQILEQDQEHPGEHSQVQEFDDEDEDNAEDEDEDEDEDHHDPEFDVFTETVQFDELCKAASGLRDGLSCRLGDHTIGGFNVIYEILFSDGVIWMARIPLPYRCYQPDEISACYAATLKYLRKNSTIPVPQVYGFCRQSDSANKTKVTYVFMEKMKGHHLPTIEKDSEDATPEEIAIARKVHEQLTDVILQLAALPFDKIGALCEGSDGNFFVGPYIDSTGTAFPKYKAEAYKSLKPQHRGPFTSTSAWYRGIARLNRKCVLGDPDPEMEDIRDKTIAEYELLAEFVPRIALKAFAKGPFVITHNDLTPRNILVDDDFNITCILDFPGNIVPLPSLCVYPWMFTENLFGLVVERDEYRQVFINRKDSYNSALSCRVRKMLMKTAIARQNFESGLLGPYLTLMLPVLCKRLHGRRYNHEVECRRIAETRVWYKKLVKSGADGLYSWEREEEDSEDE